MKKKPAQLDREIAAHLRGSGQPGLAEMLASPVFAKELRHELQTQRTSRATAAAVAARPFVVKAVEAGRRALIGRYPTETAAKAKADQLSGWVEYEGRVIYGREP